MHIRATLCVLICWHKIACYCNPTSDWLTSVTTTAPPTRRLFYHMITKASQFWHCLFDKYRTPPPDSINFYLFTRRNMDAPEHLKINFNDAVIDMLRHFKREAVPCSALRNDNEDFLGLTVSGVVKSRFFNTRAPTKVLIHGFGESRFERDMNTIKAAYLGVGDYNVIMVDWSALAESPCYTAASRNARTVGATIARLLDQLALSGADPGRVHLIGYSLGAQAAGYAGTAVRRGMVCRITGLDPALPLFRSGDADQSLDSTDAQFVDVIHTAGGFLAVGRPVGHVDFYPNGGHRQPGCSLTNLFCSHTRAPYYFAESVTSKLGFRAKQCGSWNAFTNGHCNFTLPWLWMGEPCPASANGTYFLRTRDAEPFALG